MHGFLTNQKQLFCTLIMNTFNSRRSCCRVASSLWICWRASCVFSRCDSTITAMCSFSNALFSAWSVNKRKEKTVLKADCNSHIFVLNWGNKNVTIISPSVMLTWKHVKASRLVRNPHFKMHPRIMGLVYSNWTVNCEMWTSRLRFYGSLATT